MHRLRFVSFLFAAFVYLIAVFLIISCESENPAKPEPNPLIPTLISFSDCLDNTIAAGNSAECFEYSFDSSGNLSILHHNAAFNCCPDSIYADFEFSGQTIIINEHEGLTMPCHCLCLYDIEYQIDNISPGIYTLIFNDPYVSATDSMLSGTINLGSNPEGSVCLERGYYPWPEPTSGALVDFSDCQSFTSAHVPQTCIHFEYDGYYMLDLSHINAWYNCCLDSISAAFTFSNDSIVVSETEWLENGGCDCICPVNIDLQIENLLPGIYTLVIGSATVDPAARQSIVLDLRRQINDTYCFEE